MKSKIGEKHLTKEGYFITIIDSLRYNNCTVQFEDGLVLYKRKYDHIVSGSISNPNHPSVFNTGYYGVGRFTSRGLNGKLSKMYNTWSGILERCHCEKFKLRVSTYDNAKICASWKCLQNFGEWFEESYNPEIMDGWHLDKDILVKGNKIYSPETCAFVPKKINSIFKSSKSYRGDYPIGVTECCGKYRAGLNKGEVHEHLGTFDTIEEAFQAYKVAKEMYIKKVADEYRDRIDSRVYEAMYNYQVEITD